jgi:hypothetical protein
MLQATMLYEPSRAPWRQLAHKQRSPVFGWITDERFCTFEAFTASYSDRKLEHPRLDVSSLEEAQQQQLPGEGGAQGAVPGGSTMAVIVNVKRTNVLLRNTLRTPVLELDARETRLQWCKEVRQGRM